MLKRVFTVLATAVLAGVFMAAPVGLAATDRVGDSAVGQTMGFPDCSPAHFCWWIYLDGQGPQYQWQPGTCGDYLDLTLSLRDNIESINNQSQFRIFLLDWNAITNRWDTLWRSERGNWGNLPPEARNRTDRIYAQC